jgi:L-serine deaminase
MLEKPSTDSAGRPACPRCDGELVYVEENIQRDEYKVNQIGVVKAAGAKTLLMAEISEKPTQSENLETLKFYIECESSPNCAYRVSSEYLGEVG